MSGKAALIGAFNRMMYEIDDATQAIVEDIGKDVQARARINAVKFKYDYPEAPKPPGRLASSIIMQGPYGSGVGRYRAGVGPTAVYGKQREFGGEIHAPQGHTMGMRFHYRSIYYHHVKTVSQQEYPEGRYLSPAGRDAADNAMVIVQVHLDKALFGA